MKKKTLLLSAVTGLLMFSGCAKHFNETFKSNIKDDVNLSQSINFHNYVKEKQNNNFFIDFSIDKDLKSALATLNEHDKNSVYLLENTQENIIFPTLTTNDSKKLHINSYYKLKKFVANSTNYIIKVKNPFKKGLKKVIVIDKEKMKNDIFNYPFQIHGKVSIKQLLKKISETTHYSVIFDDTGGNNKSSVSKAGGASRIPMSPTAPTGGMMGFSSANSTGQDEIDFNGKTIGDLLNYISNQFNYFVDIDYKNKLILFKKYKTFTFNVLFSDESIQNSQAKTAATHYITNMISSIKSFVKDGTIDYKGGIIFAKITKNDYQTVSSLVKKMNDEFLKQAKINVDIYVFALKKDINFGTDFSIIKRNISAITNYNALPVLKTSKYSRTTQKKFNVNSDNSVLSFVTKYSFYNRIVNKIPITLNFDKDRDYIKSIQQTTTTSTATTSTTSTQIGTIVEGQSFTIIPNIYSNKVFLKTLFIDENNENLEEKTFGQNNIVMLPTNTKKTLPNSAILKFGERKIVGVYQIYKRLDNVQGLIPTDVPVISRIVGNNKINYIREVVAVVISVNK